MHYIVIDLWQINSSLFPLKESNFCPLLIMRDFLEAQSYPNLIKVIIFNIQYYSQKTHSEIAMTPAPNNTSKEPQTAPRRLAGIHRRQAIHTRIQQNEQKSKALLGSFVLTPKRFLGRNPETSRNSVIESGISCNGTWQRIFIQIRNKTHETTPLTW